MTEQELKYRVRDASRTWRLLPDPERKHLRPKLATWPDYVQKREEAYGYDGARMPKIFPTSRQITRAEELAFWIWRFTAQNNEKYKMGVDIMWKTWGENKRLEELARDYRCSIVTLINRRAAAVSMILLKISRDKPAFLRQ
jgi:hypothetical protein